MGDKLNVIPGSIIQNIADAFRNDPGLTPAAGLLDQISQNILANQSLEIPGGASGSSVHPRTNSEAEARARPLPAELHFVDKYRVAIIARTSLVPSILDSLLGQQWLNQEENEVILAEKTSYDKMRKLYEFVSRWDNAGKDLLYEALKANNGHLIRTLENKEKLTGVGD